MDSTLFSLSVNQKHQASMRRRSIVFSIILFLFIFLVGSIAFILLMSRFLHDTTSEELVKAVELERLRLEASVNSEITIVLKMADSPLIKKYFINPETPDVRELAFEEIKAYRRAFTARSIFWINDKDKIYYTGENEAEPIDVLDPDNFWYNKTLYETDIFNFNINHNTETNITSLWINAPVFDDNKKPIGIVGTGINISNFINNIYSNYNESARLYFFNAAGEITGARMIDLVKNKVKIEDELGSLGREIVSKIKTLKSDEIINFDSENTDAVVVVGAIPALNWYVSAIHKFTLIDSIKNGMALLFIIMMMVILSVFALFNVFLARLLAPLYNIVKEVSQISSDWELNKKNESEKKDEIETLGEFLNMTIIDQLTGIYNRRFFDGNMKKIIRSLSHTGGKLSLLMIDIDFFKKYNDTYGHDAGDTCLKEVAAILNKSINRGDDFTARYGGEEFVVVLPNADSNGARIIAERLLKNICDANIPHEKNEVAPYITVSIGGTTGIVNNKQEESDYVKSADTALYKSKQNGRNRYTFEPFKENGA